MSKKTNGECMTIADFKMHSWALEIASLLDKDRHGNHGIENSEPNQCSSSGFLTRSPNTHQTNKQC